MSVPVVVLHALAPGSVMWAGQRAALTRSGLRVLAPDQRGYGAMPLRADPPSLDAAADDLARALDDQGIGEIALAGVSMGGYVAMAFLRRHPGRVRALGLLATKAGPDDAREAALRHAFAEAVRDPATAPDLVRAATPALVGATTRANRPGLLAGIEEMVAAVAPETLAWSQLAIAARPDSFDVLRATDVPALVMAGEEDKLVPPAAAKEMAAALPAAELVTVPRAGHLIPLEAPGIVTSALTALLDRAERSHAER